MKASSHAWILEVLADLETYTLANGLVNASEAALTYRMVVLKDLERLEEQKGKEKSGNEINLRLV